MKLCYKCGVNPRVADSNRSRSRYCKPCWSNFSNEWNKKNRDRVRDLQLRRKFGITLEQYRELECEQGGVCAICFEVCNSGRVLAVDHDHKTGKIRGLLCGSCNRAIGLLKDSPLVIDNAAKYLRSTS